MSSPPSPRTHVALLRGINVGGHNSVAMSELRRAVASLGHSRVVTYIQSGNVAFRAAAPKSTSDELADDLEAAIADQLGVQVPVVVVSRRDLEQVVSCNPFPEEPNPKLVHAVFLRAAPSSGDAAVVAVTEEREQARGGRDRAQVAGQTLYLWTPDGLGRSRLAAQLDRNGRGAAPSLAGTTRNWATVLALIGLLDS
jgi:uncharacterized protein (DUF1697 family)